MICIDTVIKYCKDDLSLIENYEEALNNYNKAIQLDGEQPIYLKNIAKT